MLPPSLVTNSPLGAVFLVLLGLRYILLSAQRPRRIHGFLFRTLTSSSQQLGPFLGRLPFVSVQVVVLVVVVPERRFVLTVLLHSQLAHLVGNAGVRVELVYRSFVVGRRFAVDLLIVQVRPRLLHV